MNEEKLTRSHRHTIKGIDGLQMELDIIYNNSESGISPKEIIKAIYPDHKRFLHQVARGWVVLTLKLLEKKNLIKRKDTKKKILFFPGKDD